MGKMPIFRLCEKLTFIVQKAFFSTQNIIKHRLQNSPYFCVFKYARAVKQKVWACEARALRTRKTLTPRFTDFSTDFEKKTDCFAVYIKQYIQNYLIKKEPFLTKSWVNPFAKMPIFQLCEKFNFIVYKGFFSIQNIIKQSIQAYCKEKEP